MADQDDSDADLKALAALYSVLCFVTRELARLKTPCEEAEIAVAAAQSAVRARMVEETEAAVADELQIPRPTLLN